MIGNNPSLCQSCNEKEEWSVIRKLVTAQCTECKILMAEERLFCSKCAQNKGVCAKCGNPKEEG